MDRSRKPTDDEEVAVTTLLEQDFVVRKVLRKAPFTNCEPMNTRSIGGISEGTVLNPKNSATGVSGMGEASLLLGLLAMGRSGKVRTFAPKKSGTLFGLGFLGSNLAKPSLPDLFTGFVSTDVLATSRQKIGMSFFQMLGLAQAFKVFNSVVSFVMVDVMDLFGRIKPFQPAFSHGSVKEPLASQKQITVFGKVRGVRCKLSESFPTTGHSVVGVKNFVGNSVKVEDCHVVPFGDEGISMLTQIRGKLNHE